VPKSTTKLSVKDANAHTGGLSNTDKMPGKSYNTSARDCKAGTRLRAVKGSVCDGCYAMKGRYMFPVVQTALRRRLDAIDDPLWVDAMVVLISRQRVPWFRWHDSGDLQSVAHLEKIIDVCNRTPEVHHWLPTREYKIVADYRKAGGIIPGNLVIRLSAHMVDGIPPAAYGLPTSTVVTSGRTCPAPDQDNQCGKCRQCWSPTVKNVAYGKH
jgi:hypothetical protein